MKNNEKKYNSPNNKELYELITKKTKKIFANYDEQDFLDAINIVSKFNNMDQQRSNKPYYEYFIYQDYKENKKGLEKLFDLCMLYNLNFFAFIDAQFLMDNLMNKTILKALKSVPYEDSNESQFLEVLENQTSQKYQESLKNLILDNINNFFSNSNYVIEDFKSNLKFNQSILKNTFKEAIKEIKEKGFKLPINIPHNFNLDIDSIAHHENLLLEKFTKKKTLAKMNNSYLAKIALDDYGFSESLNSLYLKNLKDGIVQGYSERAFLIGVDKDKTLKDLQTKLEHLKDYKTEEAQSLKNFTINLIKLVNQKRHKDKIPFKIIGKKLGMTSNEAKNYCKIVLSINEKSFKDFYEQ